MAAGMTFRMTPNAPTQQRDEIFSSQRLKVGWRASADRTSLRPPFPANREFYREFRRSARLCRHSQCRFPTDHRGFWRIPWNQEQGNLPYEQGLISPEHRSENYRAPTMGQSLARAVSDDVVNVSTRRAEVAVPLAHGLTIVLFQN